VQAQVNAGYAFLRAGDEKTARRYAEAALRLDPQSPDPYLLLAQIEDHHGTALQALDDAQKYLRRSPNQTPGLFLVGRTYARMADGPHSEEWLKRALDAAPDNAEVWLTLGRVYFEMYRSSRTEDALRCFEKAYQLEPGRWETNLWLGRGRAGQKRYVEAIPLLQAAIRLSPQPGSLFYDLAQAELQAGRREEGEKTLAVYQQYQAYTRGVQQRTTAIANAPRDRALRDDLARFCLINHQFRPALAVLRDTARLLGDDATSRQLRQQAEDGLRSVDAHSGPPPGGAP
jgi:tetratricopeptide (TPR) repeat protein